MAVERENDEALAALDRMVRAETEQIEFQNVSPVSPAVYREEALRSTDRRDGRRSEGDGPFFGLAWNSVSPGNARELNLTHFTNCVGRASRAECDGELRRPLARHRLAMD